MLNNRIKQIPQHARRLLNAIYKLSWEKHPFTANERVILRDTYNHLATNNVEGAKLVASQTEISNRLLAAVLN